jgi:CelD/BcsL family acetyltransferase involved in cellulose biosynthesis
VNETIEWVEEPGRFAELADQWDRLAGPDALPFDCHAWYEAWRAGFVPEARLATCTLWRDGQLAAALPMWRDRGGRLEPLANVHTPWYRPLASDEAALGTLLATAFAATASSVALFPLAIEDPLPTIEDRAQAAGRHCLWEELHLSPIIDLQGTYEDWVRATRRQWRSDIPRFRRKMQREHEVEMRIVAEPLDLEAELDRGFQVEASGWKGRGGTAILSSPETEAFYRGVARAFHRRGELRLSSIVLDGQTVAFDLCLLSGGRLYLLKTGFDERFRTLAPGLVLRLTTVERCFEEGLEAHELLGDDAPWKRKFATRDRQHCGIRAYSASPRGRAHLAYRGWIRPALATVYHRALRR